MKHRLLVFLILLLSIVNVFAQKPAPKSPSIKTAFRWKMEGGINYYTINQSLPNVITNKPAGQISIGGKIIWYRKISLHAGAGLCLKSYRSTLSESTNTYDPANNIYPYDYTLIHNNNILSAEFPVTINYKINSSFSFYGGTSFSQSLNSFYHNITKYVYHKTLLETSVTKQNGTGGLSFNEERKDNIYAVAGLRYIFTNRLGLNCIVSYGIKSYSFTDSNGVVRNSNIFREQLNLSYSFGRHKTWEEKQVNWKIKK